MIASDAFEVENESCGFQRLSPRPLYYSYGSTRVSLRTAAALLALVQAVADVSAVERVRLWQQHQRGSNTQRSSAAMALRASVARLRPAITRTRRSFAKFVVPTKKKLEWTDAMEARVLQQMRGESNNLDGETLEDTNDKRTHISEVDAGGFELRGDVFLPSSICCLQYHAFLWRARTQEDVTVESLRLFSVVHPRPEIVVVGLGARGPRERMVDVEAHFRNEGIALEQMDTANAVNTFNILNDEGRTVGGAFLTLEPRPLDEYADPLAGKLE